MSLGENIKRYRKLKKLTQNELAQRANMSRSYLADVERDRYNPSVDTLKAIAKVLEADPNSLLGIANKQYDDATEVEDDLHRIVRELSEGPFNQRTFRSNLRDRIAEELEHLQTAHNFEVQCTPADVIQLCKEVDSIDFTIEIIEMLESVKRAAQLTEKEERDIAKDLERMLSDLESGEALAFHGETLDDESKELLRISLENSLRLAKQLAKQKFTPKKHQK